LPYDHLVLAMGSVTNFFGLPGLAERALTMKSLGDAMDLRNRLIEQLEAADFECAIGERDELLTVVVAGGGFAGVETIAGVNDFLRESLRFYPNLTERNLRVVLVHPGKLILPELGEKLGAYAQQKLAQRGVEIRVQTRVTGVDGGVLLSDGSRLPTRTLVWTAGTSPHPLLAVLPCATERGRVPVNEFLEAPGWPGVWALGDCAVIPDPRTGKPCPPTAQHALREGRVLARNILATINGRAKKPFAFSALGQLAAIGRRTGVANILGFNFSGFLAWWLWRTIYLSKLPRFEKKLRVAIDWTLDLLFAKDLVQFQTARSTGISSVERGARDSVAWQSPPGPERLPAAMPAEAAR
jgi:NADH dehydrogenase